MTSLRGKTAVITGAASGIGLAMARRFAAEGMNLALADVEEAALEQAQRELAARDIEVVAVPTDVGDAAQMDAFAARAADALAPAHLVCLNAGVAGGGGPIETLTTQDWAWGIHVNLWGVIHGLRVFLGGLKERDAGHVVVTSSIAGLTCSPQAGPYHATKHAVAAIAETLFRELHDGGSQVRVSCVCPGLVATGFPSSDRNRPAALANPGADAIPQEQLDALHAAVQAIFERGVSAEHVAECVFAAVRDNRFWVYTDDVHREVIRKRHRAIETGEAPPTDFNALDGY